MISSIYFRGYLKDCRKIIFKTIILCSLIHLGQLIFSQIITDPYRHVRSDPKKAILMISSFQSGSLIINDHFVTRLHEHDTIYLNDLDTGIYRIQIRYDQENVEMQGFTLKLKSGSVTHLIAGRDLGSSISCSPGRDEVIGLMTGRKHYSIKNGRFYGITQFSLFSFETDHREFLWFNSFGTIFGYQVRPGFCLGLGTSLNYCSSDIYADYWDDTPDKFKLWFLPLYLDFRFHLPPSANGAIYPYFKLDMGANIPLNKNAWTISGNHTIRIEKGGIYFSPGFGFRIFPADMVQIVAGFDYSLEISKYRSSYHYYDGSSYYHYEKKFFNYLKFNIGTVFQF